jgi:hypothetical protein
MPSPFPFSTLIPAAADDPADDQPVMQTNNLSTSDLIAVDHIGFVNAQGGAHNRVQLREQSGIPAAGYGAGFETVFSQVINSQGEIVFTRGNSGTIIQLTGGPNNGSVPVITTTGWTFLAGGLIMQWGFKNGSGSSGSITYPIQFPNAVFNVQLTAKYNSSSVLPTAAGTYSVDFFTISTTLFNWQLFNQTNYRGFYWTAIGN